MGKRGPKKTPTLILRQRGSWLAGTREDEVQFASGRPEPPDFLSVEARQKWDELLPLLRRAGVLTAADSGALACLCQAWGRFVQAEAILAAEGLLAKTLAGGTKPHPAVAISSGAWAQYIKACALFGIDPADRSNVTSSGSTDLDDDYLAERGRLLMLQINAQQEKKGQKRGSRKRPA